MKVGVNDDDHILLKDTPCLRLGKDGTDFSLSMWVKVSGDSQIIGTNDGYGYGPGFNVSSRKRYDGSMELALFAGPMPREKRGAEYVMVSPPFKANEWVHMTLVYDSNGPGKMATFSMWLNLSSTPEPARSTLSESAPIQVYQPNLKIGDQGYGRSAMFEVSEMRSYSRVLTMPEIKALVAAANEPDLSRRRGGAGRSTQDYCSGDGGEGRCKTAFGNSEHQWRIRTGGEGGDGLQNTRASSALRPPLAGYFSFRSKSLAAASAAFWSAASAGHLSFSRCISWRMAALTISRMSPLSSAGTTYHGLSFVAVALTASP